MALMLYSAEFYRH